METNRTQFQNVENKAYSLLKSLRILDSNDSHIHNQSPQLPWITLTYAQTLDGFIALPKQQLALSSPESLVLTHALRASHDAILVGIQTVICDNPSLSTRLVERGPPPASISPPPNPRPIILDSKLRCPPTAKVLSRRPLILTIYTPHESLNWKALNMAGAEIVTVPANSAGRIDMAAALIVLYEEYQIRSIMIEGGSKVIQECLSNTTFPIDRLIVTIAPMFLGHGIHAVAGSIPSSPTQTTLTTHTRLDLNLQLTDIHYTQFGRDSVMSAVVQKHPSSMTL